jgi:hypothetical protein
MTLSEWLGASSVTRMDPSLGFRSSCLRRGRGQSANSSVDAADSYFASTASSDNMLPRYNVNTFLNSTTTRTFPL